MGRGWQAHLAAQVECCRPEMLREPPAVAVTLFGTEATCGEGGSSTLRTPAGDMGPGHDAQ